VQGSVAVSVQHAHLADRRAGAGVRNDEIYVLISVEISDRNKAGDYPTAWRVRERVLDRWIECSITASEQDAKSVVSAVHDDDVFSAVLVEIIDEKMAGIRKYGVRRDLVVHFRGKRRIPRIEEHAQVGTGSSHGTLTQDQVESPSPSRSPSPIPRAYPGGPCSVAAINVPSPLPSSGSRPPPPCCRR